jgi:hypothetical protein
MLRFAIAVVCLTAFARAQGSLHLETRRIEKSSPGCFISFEYPEAISALTVQARDRINAGILGVLLRSTGIGSRASGSRTLSAYAANFLGFCRQYHDENRGLQSRDLYERKAVVLLRSKAPVLSFRCSSDADMGGAHPFGTILYVNFDSSTGRPAKLIDFLKTGSMPQLESIAEARFRRDHGLSSAQRLSEAGYNFAGDRFHLNDNYSFGESALVFVFNTYEIAAGAMGPTELTIPYAEITQILRPGTGLQ